MMKQKHYIDIMAIREDDTELRERNTKSFEVGDHVNITEKFDGSNASVGYDADENELYAFSRKQTLNESNTLNGFWNFVHAWSDKQINAFKRHSTWRVFGEWSNKNKIIYNDTGKLKHWYVFDIYDTESEQWLSQEIVKDFCKESGLEYIHVLYDGEFISWEHCKSFMNSPAYGDKQEGIVVKNQDKMYAEGERNPSYLKIVNDSFKESMKTRERVIDPNKEQAKEAAQQIVNSIVTKSRVEKELYKMRDEQLIPEKIAPSDMGLIARTLPKRIYNDCVKEEKELVEQCGELFGKFCGTTTMRIAKEIILGN